jgi:hypothetical protein
MDVHVAGLLGRSTTYSNEPCYTSGRLY